MNLKEAALLLKNRFRRTRGFALNEMLIVILILAILMGMYMVAMGPAQDRTTATRITSDLDSLRSAVLAYSNAESWNRDAFVAGNTLDAGMVKVISLSPYLAKDIGESFSVLRVNDRLLVGFENHSKITSSVEKRLRSATRDGGFLKADGNAYSGGRDIFVYVR